MGHRLLARGPPAGSEYENLPGCAAAGLYRARVAFVEERRGLASYGAIRALPIGHRTEKFAALTDLRLNASDWTECPQDWRAPFLPASTGAWAAFPKLEPLFVYNGSGTMPGRTWIIAPDAVSLQR